MLWALTPAANVLVSRAASDSIAANLWSNEIRTIELLLFLIILIPDLVAIVCLQTAIFNEQVLAGDLDAGG
jgi:hypothetical protein